MGKLEHFEDNVVFDPFDVIVHFEEAQFDKANYCVVIEKIATDS